MMDPAARENKQPNSCIIMSLSMTQIITVLLGTAIAGFSLGQKLTPKIHSKLNGLYCQQQTQNNAPKRNIVLLSKSSASQCYEKMKYYNSVRVFNNRIGIVRTNENNSDGSIRTPFGDPNRITAFENDAKGSRENKREIERETTAEETSCPIRNSAIESDQQERIQNKLHATFGDETPTRNEAYYEALVHPTMLTHSEPKRILLFMGKHQGTLQQVLKHNTVEHVSVISASPVFSDQPSDKRDDDCSDLMESAPSCFRDPRVEIVHGNHAEWLLGSLKNQDKNEDLFDVVILDDSIFFLEEPNSMMYPGLIESISNALGQSGIFVVPCGKIKNNEFLHTLIDMLLEEEFQKINHYSHSHDTSFLVGMKSERSLAQWISSEAGVQLLIHNRIVSTKSGNSALRFVDGATMKTFEFPSRVLENAWCTWTNQTSSEECNHGFDPDILDTPMSSFEVKESTVAFGGRGVFAKEFVPEGSSVGLESCVNGIFMFPNTFRTWGELEELDVASRPYHACLFDGFMAGYGWQETHYGDISAGVDTDIATFFNHGCNGSYNVGTKMNATESTIDITSGPEEVYDDTVDAFNPFDDRHFPLWECNNVQRASRDIHPGEEILDNYLAFGGSNDLELWERTIEGLKRLCSGGTGLVTDYEKKQPT